MSLRRDREQVPASTPRVRGTRRAGLAVVFLWFFIGGVAHFVATEAEVRVVPPYIPWPWAAVIVSGVFELLGSAGVLWHRTRRVAGFGLFLLTLAVTPVHVYMLQFPERYPVPEWALWLRLPLQVALLALIAWSTRMWPLNVPPLQRHHNLPQNDRHANGAANRR